MVFLDLKLHFLRNLNFLLQRISHYNPVGRVQTEEESDEIAGQIKELMNENNLEYIEIPGDIEMAEKITEKIIEKLKI